MSDWLVRATDESRIISGAPSHPSSPYATVSPRKFPLRTSVSPPWCPPHKSVSDRLGTDEAIRLDKSSSFCRCCNHRLYFLNLVEYKIFFGYTYTSPTKNRTTPTPRNIFINPRQRMNTKTHLYCLA